MITPVTRLPSATSAIQRLRNLGIAAHIDAGKTTLTERILYFAGVIHSCGDVHDGNTKTDFSPIEKQKGITISAASVPCVWTAEPEPERMKLFAGEEHRFNVIDTPGHVDFTAEVERSLRVLDGAIAVFCGVAGVQPQSETVWRQADRYQVPRIAFINKMDRTGANFDNVVTELRQKLRANAAAILLPLGSESSLRGQLDIINRKALLFEQGRSGGYVTSNVPAEFLNLVETRRSELVSRLAEVDEEIAAHWLSEQPISAEALHAAIRRQTILNRFVPVIGGSAYKFVGVEPLMDAVVQYLPSPADRPPSESHHDIAAEPIEPNPESSLVALAFKQVNDKLTGRLVFTRIYRGTLRKGDTVWNPRTRSTERVGRLVRVFADKREELASASAGEICAVIGLRGFTTGDTLCDPDHVVMLESPSFPDPVVSMALEVRSSVDQQRLATALGRLSDEDPTFRTFTHPDTGQCIIAGMGELHLDVIRQKLEIEHGLETQAGAPEIAYRESITREAEADHLLKKQSGGSGMYARVKLRVRPDERGNGLTIENRVTGGSIPSHFISAVERGIRNAAQTGVLAGYPLVDARVQILDGAAHVKDSNDLAFQLAATEALREAVREASPVLLEPVMQVECTVPPDHQGDILGDLNRRRGKISGMESKQGISLVRAEVPLAEMFGYADTIRSLSRGRASYAMTPVRFAPVPAALADKVQTGRSK